MWPGVNEQQPNSETNAVQPAEGISAVLSLSCLEMWLDGIKATKASMDPVSSCFGVAVGMICCVVDIAANAQEDKRHTATRHDVIHADQIRKNEEAEAGVAFALGACLGDALVDTASVSVGVLVGGVRAAFFTCTGNNQRDNTVFGYPRAQIDEVKLFDACIPSSCR